MRSVVAAALAGAVLVAAVSDGPRAADGAGRVAFVRDEGGRYRVEVDGRPFAVRGAGLGRDDPEGFAALAAIGGTALRTWETDGIARTLDLAREHGLRVLVGLGLEQELAGFDYGDRAAVARQHERVAALVDRLQDHPAVLGWLVINEPNLVAESDADGRADPAVYDAVADIARHVRRVDPHRPVGIAFAFTATVERDVADALARAPMLDFLAFQGYGALVAIPELVARLDLDRPYMVTEFGPIGHWEMPATDWGREIEEPSGPKARGIAERMRRALANDPSGLLVGHFAFLWGQKQERTPTWYGMFVERERTAVVDELARFWTGEYPENRAPLAEALTVDGVGPTASLRVHPGQRLVARLDVSDPDGDALGLRWELREEVAERSVGGHVEAVPAEVTTAFEPLEGSGDDTRAVAFDAPARAGEYRLYGYARDGRGGVGTANFPFLVDGEARGAE